MKKLACLWLSLGAAAAWAAGGHHAVDDASILEPGGCEVESWATHVRSGNALHAGAGCRVGPMELAGATEYVRQHATGSQTDWSLQAKWAQEVAKDVSLGVSVAPKWQARARPRYQATTVAVLATWNTSPQVALHLNLGRDLVHRGGDVNRSGASIEWTPGGGWTVLAERYVEESGHFVRAGLRWALTDSWKLDLSRAQRLRGPGESSWTLGLTWEFSRP